MENPFIYSDTNKRYHTFHYFLKQKFGCKVAKISLDAGFTCPNIDGTKGYGGCTYCSAKGSGDFAGDKNLPLREQFDQIRTMMGKKWADTKYICFCQYKSKKNLLLIRKKHHCFHPVMLLRTILFRLCFFFFVENVIHLPAYLHTTWFINKDFLNNL